jgi:hypothetical protein
VRSRADKVRKQAHQWALTVHKSEHYGAAARSRWVIIVSLRTAASAEVPWSPIVLSWRLHSEGWGGDGERVDVSMGSDRKAEARPKAHLSEVTELPLSPSHSSVMPAVVYSP